MPPERTAPHLSVIIPCYNEQKNLENGVLDEVQRHLVAQDYPWEVIIVNDESTDGSRALIEAHIARSENFSLLDIPHGGKPAAIWAGIQEAKGEIVLFADMDQSTPIGEIDRLLPWYRQGFEVVVGSRGAGRHGSSPIRRLSSIVFRGLRRFLLLREISDTQCGFKSCVRRVALEVFPRLRSIAQHHPPTGWKVSAFDVEFLYLLQRYGCAVKEVAVRWSNRDQSDTKGQETGRVMQYVRESIEMAEEVVRVKLNEIRGLYDKR